MEKPTTTLTPASLLFVCCLLAALYLVPDGAPPSPELSRTEVEADSIRPAAAPAVRPVSVSFVAK